MEWKLKMFKPGDVWRHKACLDMDLIIMSVPYKGLKYFKVKVLYGDRHHGNRLYDNRVETVKIYRKEFPKWELINGIGVLK